MASLVLGVALGGGCSGGGSDGDAKPPAVIPVTRAACTPFGNPPRPRDDALTAAESTQCWGGGHRLADWVDPNGTTRRACHFEPASGASQGALPLVVFLQGSAIPSDFQLPVTNVLDGRDTADLSGDPSRPGFYLLEPVGRVTDHFYPPPDDVDVTGWDVWYRQFQPDRPARVVNGETFPMNPDFAALDHYIGEMVATGHVDRRRIFVLGWSNGAALALEYGQNRATVAAVAMYSGPSPYGALADPCPQTPVAGAPVDDTELQVFRPGVPVFHVQNACDVLGTCPNGLALRDTLLATGTADIRHQIVDVAKRPVDHCVAACGTNPMGGGTALGNTLGLADHFLWPTGWTDDFFAFFRDHPLAE